MQVNLFGLFDDARLVKPCCVSMATWKSGIMSLLLQELSRSPFFLAAPKPQRLCSSPIGIEVSVRIGLLPSATISFPRLSILGFPLFLVYFLFCKMLFLGRSIPIQMRLRIKIVFLVDFLLGLGLLMLPSSTMDNLRRWRPFGRNHFSKNIIDCGIYRHIDS